MVAGSMVDCGGEEGGGERGQALCLRERSPRQMNLESRFLRTNPTLVLLCTYAVGARWYNTIALVRARKELRGRRSLSCNIVEFFAYMRCKVFFASF